MIALTPLARTPLRTNRSLAAATILDPMAPPRARARNRRTPPRAGSSLLTLEAADRFELPVAREPVQRGRSRVGIVLAAEHVQQRRVVGVRDAREREQRVRPLLGAEGAVPGDAEQRLHGPRARRDPEGVGDPIAFRVLAAAHPQFEQVRQGLLAEEERERDRAVADHVRLAPPLDDPAHDPRPAAVVEEPERGLHPYLLGSLVSFLRKLTRGEIGPRAVQIVLATHSADLLDHLEPDEVRLMTRDPASGSVRVDLVPTDTEAWQETYRTYDESLGLVWKSGSLRGVPGG